MDEEVDNMCATDAISDKQICSKAIRLFSGTAPDVTTANHFLDTMSMMHIERAMGRPLNVAVPQLMPIYHDVVSLATIAHKISWQRSVVASGGLHQDDFDLFLTTDIDHFHVEMRSIFDYAAAAIAALAPKPGQVPNTSFRKLRTWVLKGQLTEEKLGKDLIELVTACDWFDDLRTVRDSLVHQGAFTISFPNSDEVLFQITQGLKRLVIVPPELMWNDNVVKFEPYAGLYMARLLLFLDSLGIVVKKRLGLQAMPSATTSHHPGYATVVDWMARAEQLLP